MSDSNPYQLSPADERTVRTILSMTNMEHDQRDRLIEHIENIARMAYLEGKLAQIDKQLERFRKTEEQLNEQS